MVVVVFHFHCVDKGVAIFLFSFDVRVKFDVESIGNSRKKEVILYF